MTLGIGESYSGMEANNVNHFSHVDSISMHWRAIILRFFLITAVAALLASQVVMQACSQSGSTEICVPRYNQGVTNLA